MRLTTATPPCTRLFLFVVSPCDTTKENGIFTASQGGVAAKNSSVCQLLNSQATHRERYSLPPLSMSSHRVEMGLDQ